MNHDPVSLFAGLGIKPKDKKRIAKEAGIREEALTFWEKNRLLPSEIELRKLAAVCGVSPLAVKLRMGIIDEDVALVLRSHADRIADICPYSSVEIGESSKSSPSFS